MLSVDGTNRYYIFQLAVRAAGTIFLSNDRTERNARVVQILVAARIARRIMIYLEYVMDPLSYRQ
jgi:hypothetical protein